MKRKTIILLLVCVSILATGCKLAIKRTQVERQYEAGNFIVPLRALSNIMMGIKADTNVFEKENVSMELYIGLYDNAYVGEKMEYVASCYKSSVNEPLYVGVYICEGEYEYTAAKVKKHEDYRKISNYNLVNEISEQEAFSGKYGYDVSSGRSITYNHSDLITIPEECFANEQGKLYINTIVFRDENDGMYTVIDMEILKINYQLTEDGKITITNLEK